MAGRVGKEIDKKMSDIVWTNTTVKLGDLKPWTQNPRQSTKKQARKLLESWEKFGQVQTIAVDPDGNVLDGHQRLSALLTVYGPTYRVDARQSNRALTEQERKELVITLHAGSVGSWDWDSLSGWDAPDLMEWGFDSETLADWKRDVGALTSLVASESVLDEEDAFSALPDEDRAPFQQMTFTLHDTQAETVREALKVAKALGEFVDSENENSNGNALARICEMFLGEHDNG